MAKNPKLIDVVAKTLGLNREHVAEIAAALGMDRCAPATIPTAVDLVIAALAATTPAEAPRRLALYRALPLTDCQWLNLPRPDGTLGAWSVPVEDFPVPPGDGPRVARISRSFGEALEQFIEHRVSGNPEFFATPYMIKGARRDTAPLAFIGTMAKNRAEEILLYRHTEDSEQSYTLASYRLTLFADAHGHVLDAIADLLGAEAQHAAREPTDTLARRKPERTTGIAEGGARA